MVRTLRLVAVVCLGVAFAAVSCGKAEEDGEPRRGTGGRGDGGTGDRPGLGGDAGAFGTGSTGTGSVGTGAGGSGGKGTGGIPGVTGPVCFLNTCQSNEECAGCSFGRNTCNQETNRCVACDPVKKTGCATGTECTQYGTCAAPGAVCPADLKCTTDQDCAACDGDLQVCDATLKKCVRCKVGDLSACQGNETCQPTTGECAPKCPTSCNSDAECAACKTDKTSSTVCGDNHKCVECSKTKPCAAGLQCSPTGRCAERCGGAGLEIGKCKADADCVSCGDATKCIKPLNNPEGKCGIPAAGCEVFGAGGLVLPEPWGSVTQLCEDDAGCSQQGVNFDVGKALRDLTGLDLFQDATVQYGMHACATVEVSLGAIGVEEECGVCVPCRDDKDCAPIRLDPILDQMLGGFGSIAAKWALSQIFGDKASNLQLEMVCEPLAAGYGACVPCFDCTAAPETLGEGCEHPWDCGYNEFCVANECVEYTGDCFITGCSGNRVCSWNGDGKFCCRTNFPDKADEYACTYDEECEYKYPGKNFICARNQNNKFYCTDPDSTCE